MARVSKFGRSSYRLSRSGLCHSLTVLPAEAAEPASLPAGPPPKTAKQPLLPVSQPSESTSNDWLAPTLAPYFHVTTPKIKKYSPRRNSTVSYWTLPPSTNEDEQPATRHRRQSVKMPVRTGWMNRMESCDFNQHRPRKCKRWVWPARPRKAGLAKKRR